MLSMLYFNLYSDNQVVSIVFNRLNGTYQNGPIFYNEIMNFININIGTFGNVQK